MVFVGDKKYACETCIKGHRSSSCRHTDRPLFEIKKKGRPVTQCDHCRELRKTRQVHVKCICEVKDSSQGGSTTIRRGGGNVPPTATFPSGLPEELEASVTMQAFSDSSDSDHSGCACKDSGSCNCFTPRASAKRQGKARERRGSEAPSSRGDLEGEITQPAGLVVHANTGVNRPVLPRPPTAQRPASPAGPPSTTTKAYSPRHQSHGQMFYSPYGRAYGYSHNPDSTHEPAQQLSFQPAISDIGVRATTLQQAYADQTGTLGTLSWIPPVGAQTSSGQLTLSLCGCGASCACPGCVQHRGPDVNPSMPCANPGTCLFCLDCGIPTSAPTNSSAQAQYDTPSLQNIDDWLREVSAVPSFQSPNIQLDSPFSSILGQGQPDTRFDPAMLQTYALWSSLQNGQAQSQLSRSIPQECCGGRCKCPAGMCACAADCCGCCQGCQCPECEHGDDPNKILTFAVSGERGSCCGGAHTHGRTETYAPHVPVAGPSGANINGGVGSIRNEGRDEGTAFRGPNDGWFDQSLTLPRTSTLSRASSRSSKSSSQQSYQSSSPAPYTDGVGVSHGMGADMHVVRACCASMEMINTSMSIDGSSNSPSPGPPDRTNDVVDYAQSSRMF